MPRKGHARPDPVSDQTAGLGRDHPAVCLGHPVRGGAGAAGRCRPFYPWTVRNGAAGAGARSPAWGRPSARRALRDLVRGVRARAVGKFLPTKSTGADGRPRPAAQLADSRRIRALSHRPRVSRTRRGGRAALRPMARSRNLSNWTFAHRATGVRHRHYRASHLCRGPRLAAGILARADGEPRRLVPTATAALNSANVRAVWLYLAHGARRHRRIAALELCTDRDSERPAAPDGDLDARAAQRPADAAGDGAPDGAHVHGAGPDRGRPLHVAQSADPRRRLAGLRRTPTAPA